MIGIIRKVSTGKGLLSPWGMKMVKKGQERDGSESHKAKRN